MIGWLWLERQLFYLLEKCVVWASLVVRFLKEGVFTERIYYWRREAKGPK